MRQACTGWALILSRESARSTSSRRIAGKVRRASDFGRSSAAPSRRASNSRGLSLPRRIGHQLRLRPKAGDTKSPSAFDDSRKDFLPLILTQSIQIRTLLTPPAMVAPCRCCLGPPFRKCRCRQRGRRCGSLLEHRYRGSASQRTSKKINALQANDGPTRNDRRATDGEDAHGLDRRSARRRPGNVQGLDGAPRCAQRLRRT